MDKKSRKKELALRSSAAEYLTFVASTGANDVVAAAVALMAVSALGMAVLTRKK